MTETETKNRNLCEDKLTIANSYLNIGNMQLLLKNAKSDFAVFEPVTVVVSSVFVMAFSKLSLAMD